MLNIEPIMIEIVKPVLVTGIIGYLLAIWKKTSRRLENSEKMLANSNTRIKVLESEVKHQDRRHETAIKNVEDKLNSTKKSVDEILRILMERKSPNGKTGGRRWYDQESED